MVPAEKADSMVFWLASSPFSEAETWSIYSFSGAYLAS